MVTNRKKIVLKRNLLGNCGNEKILVFLIREMETRPLLSQVEEK
jgi:hypothetical protein